MSYVQFTQDNRNVYHVFLIWLPWFILPVMPSMQCFTVARSVWEEELLTCVGPHCTNWV